MILGRREACQTLSKALDISSAIARVAPDLIKTLAILADTTVKKSSVEWEDMKQYWNLEKRPYFYSDQQAHYSKVVQRFY